jgi:hypothetical protein
MFHWTPRKPGRRLCLGFHIIHLIQNNVDLRQSERVIVMSERSAARADVSAPSSELTMMGNDSLLFERP